MIFTILVSTGVAASVFAILGIVTILKIAAFT